MKKITILLLALTGFSFSNLSAQIYVNGAVSTGATAANGTAAPSGYTWSETQSDTGNTTESNGSIGFSAYYNNGNTASFAIVDDFVVPTGEIWNITSFDVFAYQTNYTGTTIPHDQMRVAIYSVNPSTGTPTPIAGDLTTNILDAANSVDAGIYRISNTLVPTPLATNTNRKIWKLRGTVTASLPAGTYWMAYQVHATNDAATFCPPVTIVGSRGPVGANAQQYNGFPVAPALPWNSLLDGGNPVAAPDVVQEAAFNINGSIVTLSNEEFDSAIFNYSPNPVQDVLNLSSTQSISKIQVLNLLGQEVLNQSVNDLNTQVDMSKLAPGSYLINITGETAQKTIKVVKR